MTWKLCSPMIGAGQRGPLRQRRVESCGSDIAGILRTHEVVEHPESPLVVMGCFAEPGKNVELLTGDVSAIEHLAANDHMEEHVVVTEQTKQGDGQEGE